MRGQSQDVNSQLVVLFGTRFMALPSAILQYLTDENLGSISKSELKRQSGPLFIYTRDRRGNGQLINKFPDIEPLTGSRLKPPLLQIDSFIDGKTDRRTGRTDSGGCSALCCSMKTQCKHHFMQQPSQRSQLINVVQLQGACGEEMMRVLMRKVGNQTEESNGTLVINSETVMEIHYQIISVDILVHEKHIWCESEKKVWQKKTEL
ncbi:hypothetical protein JOB18_025816 [Solea senegalensis]|uniref:Uncharacterized protein n=1 Tax=Solea senegalensis TaxID=28829 RepID=A0AAV6RYH7_SOLSE|nr:hypothetical protein JOB18_025816 [Solea senegalensis]